MKDKYGRSIDYLRISVTDRCNLRCTYCMPEDGVESFSHSDILSYDEIIRTVKIFTTIGIRKLKITGGEPLVRKGLPILIGELNKMKEIDDITLTTNGLLLKENLPALIENGIKGINISLDTIDKSKYFSLTRRDKLDDVLEAIEEAKKYNISLKINTVIMSKEQDFIAIANFSKDSNIHVRFIEMMPIGEGNINDVSSDYVFKQLEKAFGNLSSYNKKLGNGPAVYFHPPGFVGKIGFISAISHKFCNDCNRIRLTSQGFLKTCLQYDHGIDIRKLLRDNRSDGYIRDRIIDTLSNKPLSHQFDNKNVAARDKKKMFQIGG